MATASGDQEGLGLVTVEAIICGCPVIVSDLPVVDDVVAGYSRRFRLGDITDLAQKIDRLFKAPLADRKSIDDELRRRVSNRLDWTYVNAAYGGTLHKVIQ